MLFDDNLNFDVKVAYDDFDCNVESFGKDGQASIIDRSDAIRAAIIQAMRNSSVECSMSDD